MISPETRKGDNHQTRRCRRKFVATELDEKTFRGFKALARTERPACARRPRCRNCKVCRAMAELLGGILNAKNFAKGDNHLRNDLSAGGSHEGSAGVKTVAEPDTATGVSLSGNINRKET